MAKSGGISRFFVYILLGLLFVGLAGFGVGGFGGRIDSVASVGDTDVPAQAYSRALQDALGRQAELTGQRPTLAEAQATGLDRSVLRELLADAAVTEGARRAGLSVGDALISDEILRIPAFQGADGFDAEAYRFAVERSGYSIAQFEEEMRADLARTLLTQAVAVGLSPQPGFADAILRFAGEERAISVAEITPETLETPPAPADAAAARAFYNDNPAAFTLPERKAITYLWLTPAMLAETIEVDEAELRAAYEARAEEFRRPERRFVDRLAFADAAEAQAAADAIAAGEATFDDLVAERRLEPEDIDLGAVDQTALGEAGVEVFALEDTGVVGPLPSSFGPALYRVNAILTAQDTPFEEARAGLRAELARAASIAVLDDEVEPLEDLLAGGATLEEVAAESDMAIGQIAWSGPDADGIAAYDSFNRAAAAVTADDFAEILVLDDGGLFALRLDETLAPSLQPFEAVEAQATTLASEAALTDALAQAGADSLAAIAGGASFEEAGLTPERLTGLTRGGSPSDLPPGALERIFELAAGEAELFAAAGRAVVLRVDRIQPPDPDAELTGILRQAIEGEAQQAMAAEALRAFAQDIEARVGIQLDQQALNAINGTMP